MRLVACMLLLSGAWATAGENETFHGWSKDGSWLVYELHVDDERNELYFCATDAEVKPSWPDALDDHDRETMGELSCVRLIDPNKAPYQWKLQLSVPPVSTKQGTVSISNELAFLGEQGFVLESGDKKQVCDASGTRENSKLQKTWFHPSGKFVAAQIDGNFRHCVVTLIPVKAPKVEKQKPPVKKKK